jgi:hypothetical protein
VSIDQEMVFHPILEKREALGDSPRGRILGVFLDHLRAEIACDIEGTMATLVPEPEMHFFGYGLERRSIVGYSAVRDHYEGLFRQWREGFVERRWTRVFVDEDGIFGDGVIRQVCDEAAVERLTSYRPEPGRYLATLQCAIATSIRDGLLVGEDTYGVTVPKTNLSWIERIV